MDVIELLEQDHRKVEELFSQYETSPDDATADQICQELDVHATVEEEIVYPRLADIDPDLKQHADEEHGTAKGLIGQIRDRIGNVRELVEQLKASVEHHVEEEESKAFPEMRDQLAAELEDLGAAVARRKEDLQSSRH